jgi:hypothetical protein
MAARAAELRDEHDPRAFVCDGASPAASLLHEFETLGIDVDVTNAKEMAAACGMFFDAVEQGAEGLDQQVATGLRHIGQEELESAIRSARKRALGDGGWAWSRSGSTADITPLVSVTLAHWGYETMDEDIGAIAVDLG